MLWIFIGIFLGVIFTYMFLKLRGRVLEVFQLTPAYIIVTLVIITISIVLNVLNFFFLPEQNQEFVSGVVNFYSGLVFATFTGYFAFAQLQLSRFDKLKDEAYRYMKDGKHYRARNLYEEAYSIKNNDFTTTSNLAEIYLILKDLESFNKIEGRLRKMCLEDTEKAISSYLSIVRFLIKEDIGEAKKPLKELFKIINARPKSFDYGFWDYSDFKKTDTYKSISGESKEIIDNLIKIGEQKVSNEEREMFINKYS